MPLPVAGPHVTMVPQCPLFLYGHIKCKNDSAVTAPVQPRSRPGASWQLHAMHIPVVAVQLCSYTNEVCLLLAFKFVISLLLVFTPPATSKCLLLPAGSSKQPLWTRLLPARCQA